MNKDIKAAQILVDNFIHGKDVRTSRSFKRYAHKKYSVELINFCFIPVKKCKYCAKQLIVEDLINKSGRSAYTTPICAVCRDNRVWMAGLYTAECRRKKSDAMKLFDKTARGKELRRKLGRHNSLNLKKFFKTPAGKIVKQKQSVKTSQTMKRLIREGKFTPPITNSWTHWTAVIIDDNNKIRKFRSSWEACFFKCGQQLEYETLRVPYIDTDGINRTYVIDFFDSIRNIAYEIKPSSVYKTQKHKLDGGINWCIKNNIKFIWINEHNILQYIDMSKFTDDNDKKQLEKLQQGIKHEKTRN